MNQNDQLSLQQQDLCNLLLSDPALAVVPVSTFKAMLVSAVAAEATDIWTDRSGVGKKGTAIQVRMPGATRDYSGTSPARTTQVRITPSAFLRTRSKTTPASPPKVSRLKSSNGSTAPCFPATPPSSPDIARPRWLRPVYDYHDRFAYDVVFVAQSPQDSRDRTPTPALTDDGQGTITLSCADPNAQIYYSVNAALPVVGVTAPSSAPFKVNAGDTVRYFAYTPGMLPSFISCAQISD